MKPCAECVWPSYCSYDGLCWIEATRREDRAQQDARRQHARNKHRVEKASKQPPMKGKAR